MTQRRALTLAKLRHLVTRRETRSDSGHTFVPIQVYLDDVPDPITMLVTDVVTKEIAGEAPQAMRHWLHGTERKKPGEFVYIHIMYKESRSIRVVKGVWRHYQNPPHWHGGIVQICDGYHQMLTWGSCTNNIRLYTEKSPTPSPNPRDGERVG